MKSTASIPMDAGRYRQYELSEESSALVETLKDMVQRPVTQLSSDDVSRVVVAFAEIGKRDGILALEILFPYIRDEFLKDALQLLTDGIEPVPWGRSRAGAVGRSSETRSIRSLSGTAYADLHLQSGATESLPVICRRRISRIDLTS